MDNYKIQANQAREAFLTYDQEKLIQKFRLNFVDVVRDSLKIIFRADIKFIGERVQSLGSHANLPRAFLARYVQNFFAAACDVRADCQRQTRLADAGISRD